MKKLISITLLVVFILASMIQVPVTAAAEELTFVPKDSSTTVTAVSGGFKISGSGADIDTAAILNAKVKLDGLSYKLDLSNVVGKVNWISVSLTTKPEFFCDQNSADFKGIAFLYGPQVPAENTWILVHNANPVAFTSNALARAGSDGEPKIFNTIKKDADGKYYLYINKAQDKLAPGVNNWHVSFANNIDTLTQQDLSKMFPTGEAYLSIRINSSTEGAFDITITDLVGALTPDATIGKPASDTKTPAPEGTATPEPKKEDTPAATPAPTAAPDKAAPIPGGSGKLTISEIKVDSVKVQWKKASDKVSAAKALKYAVYYSDTNNLRTLKDIKAKGKLAKNFTADYDNFVVKGLKDAKSYWFTVVVKDEAGNEAAYAVANAKTASKGPHWIAAGETKVASVKGGFKFSGKGKDLTAAIYSEKVKIDGLSYKLDLSKAKGKVDWVGIVLSNKPEYFTDPKISSTCKGIALLYGPSIAEDHTWIMSHQMNPIKFIGYLLARNANDPETRVYNTIKKDSKGKYYLYMGKDQMKVVANADYGWQSSFADNFDNIFKVDMKKLFPDGTAYMQIVTAGRKDNYTYEATLTDIKGLKLK